MLVYFFLIKGEIDGVYIILKTSYSVNIYYDKGIIIHQFIFLRSLSFYIYIYIVLGEREREKGSLI